MVVAKMGQRSKEKPKKDQEVSADESSHARKGITIEREKAGRKNKDEKCVLFLQE